MGVESQNIPLAGSGDMEEAPRLQGEEEMRQAFWVGMVQSEIMGKIFPICMGKGDFSPVESFGKWFRERVIEGNDMDDHLLRMAQAVLPEFVLRGEGTMSPGEKSEIVLKMGGKRLSQDPGAERSLRMFIAEVALAFCEKNNGGDRGSAAEQEVFQSLRNLGSSIKDGKASGDSPRENLSFQVKEAA